MQITVQKVLCWDLVFPQGFRAIRRFVILKNLMFSLTRIFVFISFSGSYPYYDKDPFILKECPHVYFVGNQPEYACDEITGWQYTYKNSTGYNSLPLCKSSFITGILSFQDSSYKSGDASFYFKVIITIQSDDDFEVKLCLLIHNSNLEFQR